MWNSIQQKHSPIDSHIFFFLSCSKRRHNFHPHNCKKLQQITLNSYTARQVPPFTGSTQNAVDVSHIWLGKHLIGDSVGQQFSQSPVKILLALYQTKVEWLTTCWWSFSCGWSFSRRRRFGHCCIFVFRRSAPSFRIWFGRICIIVGSSFLSSCCGVRCSLFGGCCWRIVDSVTVSEAGINLSSFLVLRRTWLSRDRVTKSNALNSQVKKNEKQ